MKKSSKPVFDIDLKRFRSYEINIEGKWTPIYILKISESVTKSSNAIHGIYVLIEYIDLKTDMIEITPIFCDKNDYNKAQSQNVRHIETDPEPHIHELTQLHKIMEL